MIVRAVGIDAAFANMGFARVEIEVEAGRVLEIRCTELDLASTEKDKTKQVRVSSDRLRRGTELKMMMDLNCAGVTYAFAEVPSGTQNAAAAFGLGIATGILCCCPVPIIEVSPMEVKAAVAGRRVQKGASKREVIEWAAARWPDAPWLRAEHKARSKNGVLPAGRLLDDNEHLADALASVAAGVETPEFKRLIQLLESKPHAAASPAPRRARLAE